MQLNNSIYDVENIKYNEYTTFVDIPFFPSTIENIDFAVYDYFKNNLDISVKTNKGFKKVPLRWSMPERSLLSKEEPRKEGVFELPVITISREGINKSLSKKGSFYANVPSDQTGTSITLGKRITQEVTKKFAAASALRKTNNRFSNLKFNNKKVVYEFFNIPQIIHLNLNYSLTLTANYQEQINDMVAPLIARPGNINYIIINKNNHSYELFIEENFSQKDSKNNLSEEERIYETTVNLRVLGYLFGEGRNEKKNFISLKQNFVDVRIKEQLI